MLTPWYDVGDEVQVTGTIRDLAGAPADPSTLTVRVKPPTGPVASYVWPGSPAVNPTGTGVFTFDQVLDAAGTWYIRFEAAGTYIAAEEQQINVRASNVLS